MSEEPRGPAATPRRGSSDFSIERILAKDDTPTPSRARSLQARASYLDRGLATASGRDPTSSFVVGSKLDWLRSFCGLQTTNDADDGRRPDVVVADDRTESTKRNSVPNMKNFNGEELTWLRCTRYCPPKLPRKSSTGRSLKRKPGSHPRIPFTKQQLEVLEDKYKGSAYLARKDVVYLSDLLHLPQTRIKIWFQNRRARARRESQLLDQSSATGT